MAEQSLDRTSLSSGPSARSSGSRLNTDVLDWFGLTWVLPRAPLLTITLCWLTFQNFSSVKVVTSDSMPSRGGKMNEVVKVRTGWPPLNVNAKTPMRYYGVINNMQGLQSYIWPKILAPHNILRREHRWGVTKNETENQCALIFKQTHYMQTQLIEKIHQWVIFINLYILFTKPFLDFIKKRFFNMFHAL